jgi:hypothetical protein
MQLVFEFGSPQLAPITDAIRRAIGRLSYTVGQSAPWGKGVKFERTDDTLESIEAKLERGDIVGFSLAPDIISRRRSEMLIRYAMALAPFFDGSKLSVYTGLIEYTGKDFGLIWNLLLETPGITFACLGFEEDLELEDSQLTLDTFPWYKAPLVIGALRDPAHPDKWVIGEGPEMGYWYKKSSNPI